MKGKKILVFVLGLSMILGGCREKNDSIVVSANDYPVKIGEVTIKDRPKRVVILSDVIADIILEIGVKDQLIGRTSECDQNEISHVAEVGSIKKDNLDLNRIKELKPEIVIYETGLSKDDVNILKRSSISVIKIERAKNREDLSRVYSEIGSIFSGKETGSSKATKCAHDLLMTLDDVNRVVPKQTTPIKVCYLFDKEGTTIEPLSFENDLLNDLGLLNVAKEVDNKKLNIDNLIICDVDYIICEVGLSAAIISDEKLSKLTACKNNHVMELNSHIFMRQGKSIIDTVKFIAGKVYPQLLSDSPDEAIKREIGPDEKANAAGIKGSFEIGDSGDEILKIQNRLDELEYLHTPPNGVFDDRMGQAIKDFKYLNDLYVSDDIDNEFLELLFSNKAYKRPDPAREK